MICEDDVRTIVDEAEIVLNLSFNRLLAFKHARNDLNDAIVNFQPELANCLYNLMQFYHRIKAEEKTLIGSKSQYSPEEFRLIMCEQGKYAKAIKSVIELGKTLGDAFAWFFYRDNFSEIGKHLEHEPIGLFASGIGGRGEVEFIKRTQNLDGLFVLYHGITTMLRVGDFSLYEFDTGIVGVGELKTWLEETGALRVEAHITSKRDLKTNQATTGTEYNRQFLFSPTNTVERLNKQLSTQSELFVRSAVTQKTSTVTQFEYNLIDQVATEPYISMNSDNTLLLVGAKSRIGSLYQRLTIKGEDEDGIPKELSEVATRMIVPNSEYNQFVISRIDTQMGHSRIPVFWWDIDDEICRRIYFHNIEIATAFNPAKLLQHFVDKGYYVVDPPNHRCVTLKREKDNIRSGIGNVEQFYSLVSHSLVNTQYIIETIEAVLNDAKDGKYGSNAKIDIDIQLHNFGGPPEE